MLSVATCFIVPAYSDSSGYDVDYVTYVDGSPAHHYHYEARVTGWAWVVLTPVVWVNWLTPSRSDAFSDIGHRFLDDSFQDGF
jgi:hypothetical protein